MNTWEPTALKFASLKASFTAMELGCHLERSGFVADLTSVSNWIKCRVEDHTLTVDTRDCPRRFYRRYT